MCISDTYMFDRTDKLTHNRDFTHKKDYKRYRRNRYPERRWIQFLILRMLYEKSMHGYQLMIEMEDRGFVLPRRLESGVVYTALRRMEGKGLLESMWEKIESGPDRRIYKVTESGSKVLQAGLETIVERNTLMKDLVTFYNKNFKKENETEKRDKG